MDEVIRNSRILRRKNDIGLRQKAYSFIRDAIIGGKLRPGQPIFEEQLSSSLGFSRTPIREALQKLEQEGLVIVLPYRGTYVSDVTKEDVEEIFQIRESLEPMIAALAAPKITKDTAILLDRIFKEEKSRKLTSFEVYIEADDKLHHFIWDLAGNKRISKCLNELNNQIRRLRYLSVTGSKRLQDHVREHENIINALKTKDAKKAENAMRTHIRHVHKNILSLISDFVP